MNAVVVWCRQRHDICRTLAAYYDALNAISIAEDAEKDSRSSNSTRFSSLQVVELILLLLIERHLLLKLLLLFLERVTHVLQSHGTHHVNVPSCDLSSQIWSKSNALAGTLASWARSSRSCARSRR